MTRRDLLKFAGTALAIPDRAAGAAPKVLSGTQPLTWDGDLSVRMMDGAHAFVERKIAESIAGRAKYWKRDLSSQEAYEKSVEPNRLRFRKIIGVVDDRVPVVFERFGDDNDTPLVAETPRYRVYQVRWPVLDGVHGEGLLYEPKRTAAGYVIALPDADQTPEQFTLARQLADRQIRSYCPGADRPHFSLVGSSRDQDDGPAPPGVDLPAGISHGPPHHRL